MKILIVGSGGREHALAWKIAQSPAVTKVYCAPGNAGIAAVAECVPLAVDDVAGLRAFAEQQRVDLTVVGPEASLAAGIVDSFRLSKLRIFGPHKAAARIESSKTFSKDLMVRLRIPTAEARSFTAVRGALDYLERQDVPIVVKADGLAQGKGVVIAHTRSEARDAVTAMLEGKAFGEAGARVVIEQYVHGEEMTVMAFTDGKTVIPVISAQDHKRLGDGDTGPNTGGMGAYAPAPIGTAKLLEQVRLRILEPAVEGLSQLGCPFQGVLYAGVMVTGGGPRVLEFNARLGDPETQVVLPLLKSDLVELMIAVTEHRLDQATIEWHAQASVCVVLCAKGYPGKVQKGVTIEGLRNQDNDQGLLIFHAGTARADADPETIVTAGGRVLGVTGVGDDFMLARAKAYAAIKTIRFEGMQYRTDIGSRAFA
jgi:phosphoribosylamine--glycine ligase